MKLKKRFVFAVFLILIFLISGCGTKKDAKKSLEEIRIGTDGIVATFLPNNPPSKIVVEEGAENKFDVVMELKNKGAYPQPEETSGDWGFQGSLYLSGYDPKIIEFTPKEGKPDNLGDMRLEGKSTINPNGGQDILSFEGKIKSENLNVQKYEPTLLATSCYRYMTVAGPSVCIDPNPYSTVKENKVCTVHGLALSSQGAPIAITKIDEEAFSTKTQFRITIKNVGGGDALRTAEESFSKCKPSEAGMLGREDIDKVFVSSVKISDKELQCWPFIDSSLKGTQGTIRLINGEGSIICELPERDYGDSKTAYTTPLKIQLRYGYRITTERKISINREGSSLIGGEGNSGLSQSSGDSSIGATDGFP